MQPKSWPTVMPRYHEQTTSRSARVQIRRMSALAHGPRLLQVADMAALDEESLSLSGSHRAMLRAQTRSCTKSEQHTHTQCQSK